MFWSHVDHKNQSKSEPKQREVSENETRSLIFFYSGATEQRKRNAAESSLLLHRVLDGTKGGVRF